MRFRDLFRRLEEALEDRAFGAALLQNAALLQLLIALNRAVMEADPLEEVAAVLREVTAELKKRRRPDPDLVFYRGEDGDLSTPANITLQGIAARNAHWTQLLKAYRQKYPDAVFFIHSGSLHSDYQEPFSVSTAFNPKESFVMQFISYSRQMQNYEKFHLVTHGKYLRPGTLIWQNPQYARKAGFNVQVILPIDK